MTRKQRTPTMRDVANTAGVSLQTVSAVINKKPDISQETRERVARVVDELGYRRRSIARSLRTGKTNTIALVVSDIANPSFATMASAAEDYARGLGYNLEVYNTHDDVEREVSYVHRGIERWVDGMVFVTAEDQMTSLDELRSAEIPTVAIDRIPKEYRGPSVVLDNKKAGRIAGEHLLELGHSCICHISGPLRLRLARERLEGMQEAVQAKEGVASPCAYREGDWGCDSGYRAMRLLLRHDPRPTAVFCANDRMALGALKAIHEAGLDVPGDVSVVGLDDIEVAAFAYPPLTTVRQSFAEMGRLGVQLLIQLVEGEEIVEMHTVIEPRLNIRESTASPRSSIAMQGV